MNHIATRSKLFIYALIFGCLGAVLPSLVYASTIVVNTPIDTLDSSDNRCSLREAIENANTNSATQLNCSAGTGADTIQFSLPPTATTISLSSFPGQFVISDTLTIDGANGGNRITIDGTGVTRIFEINSTNSAININFRSLQLIRGNGTRGGAIFVSDGILNVENVTFNGNSATGEGGALHCQNAEVRITASTFTNNESAPLVGGGAVYFKSCTSMINTSTFEGNNAQFDGGALYIDTSTVDILNSTFNQNNAQSSAGGVIHAILSTIEITTSTFFSNSADLSGGAIDFSEGTVTVNNSNFISNTADNDGGAIACLEGNLNVINNGFTINRAVEGGAIRSSDNCELSMITTIFSNNRATDDGGAIASVGSALSITGSVLVGNEAQNGDGGAIYSIGRSGSGDEGELHVSNSTISSNRANNDRGGAIFNGGDEDATTTLLNSTIVNNRADQGGGLFNLGSSVQARMELANTIVAGNRKSNASLTPDDCISSLDLAEGILLSLGNNLVGVSSNCPFTATSDIVIDPALVFTQVLDPNLANNGGPTPTHALFPGSPAIDAGGNCPPPTTDQRGEPRLSPCDIGAYEAKVYSLRLTTSALSSFVGLPVTIAANVTDQFNNPPSPGLSVSFVANGFNPSTVTVPLDSSQAVARFKREVNTAASTPIRVWVNLDGDLDQDPFEPSGTVTVTWRPITMTVDGQSTGTDVEAVRTLLVSVRSDDLTEPVPGLDVGFSVSGGNIVPTEISKTNSLGQVIFSYISRAPLAIARNSTMLAEVQPAQVNATGCGGILPPTATDIISVWVDLIANRVPDGGEPFFLCEVRSAIMLASFTAHLQDDKVILDWQTAVEIDNAGFNLYRATAPEGPYNKINPQLIPGQGTGYGAPYSFIDTPSGHGPFYYKLEDIDYSGKGTFHGPIEAQLAGATNPGQNRIYIPFVER